MNTALAYNYDNGVLIITGPASIEDYRAAITSIVYINTAEPLGDVKTIIIDVTDSPVFNTTQATNNDDVEIANTSTSNSIEVL